MSRRDQAVFDLKASEIGREWMRKAVNRGLTSRRKELPRFLTFQLDYLNVELDGMFGTIELLDSAPWPELSKGDRIEAALSCYPVTRLTVWSGALSTSIDKLAKLAGIFGATFVPLL
jgi:hypothetical protein